MIPLQVMLFSQLQGRSNYKDTDLPNFYCNVLCLKRCQDVEKMLQNHCQNPVYLFFKQERAKCLEWQYLRYNFNLLPIIPWQLFIQQSVIIHYVVFSQCALFCQYTVNCPWPLHYLHLINCILIGAKSPFSGSEISSSQEENMPHCLFYHWQEPMTFLLLNFHYPKLSTQRNHSSTSMASWNKFILRFCRNPLVNLKGNVCKILPGVLTSHPNSEAFQKTGKNCKGKLLS